MIQVLYLPSYSLASLNKVIGYHWSVKAKQKKSDREIVAHYATVQQLVKAGAPRRVSMRVVLPKGKRAADEDNVWKGCLDALVQAGLLVNDSPAWVKRGPLEYVRHAGDLREVFVILEDMP
jgi:hypothetical protein